MPVLPAMQASLAAPSEPSPAPRPAGPPRAALLAERSVLRWGAAVVVAMAAHVGALWVAIHWEPRADAPGEPPSAVTIDLAPLAVGPDAPPQDVAPGPQAAEAESEPARDAAEAPVDEAMRESLRDASPMPLAEKTPEPTPQPEPAAAETPDLPQVDKAEAVLAPPASKPEPTPKKPPPPKTRSVERKPPAPKPERRQAMAPPTSRAQRAESAAAPSAGIAAVPSVSPAAWTSAMVAHLNRYKRFPPGAGTGTASVAFTISRSGQVLSARLVGSSGDPMLDQEAVAMPRRASPVPAPPPGMPGGNTIALSVPVRFNR